MALQTQQLAEFLRPFRQAVLLNAYHRRRVVRHHSHPHLSDRPALTFVGAARYPTAQEAGNETFDYRAAGAPGAGNLRLVGGALAIQARRGQQPAAGLGRWRRGERLDRVRDAHSENPPGRQRLAQRGVIQGQSPSQRVEGGGGCVEVCSKARCPLSTTGTTELGSAGFPTGS
jgi:hypothetical protein